jgi:acetyl-CoA synthetase
MSEIESLMHEARVFTPPADFVKNAAVSGMGAYHALCAEAEKDCWTNPMRLSISGTVMVS